MKRKNKLQKFLKMLENYKKSDIIVNNNKKRKQGHGK